MGEVIIRGGTIVTVDADWHVRAGDVASRDGELVAVGGDYTPAGSDYEILDAEGCVVMPGFVQSHVHMCQTLARGRADDLELLNWLRKVVWPYEASLDATTMRAAAKLACTELLLGGTTAVLDMGTVHHTDTLFEVARDAGLRATIGKAMMDEDDPQIPEGLQETTVSSLSESARLCAQWHDSAGGRLRYAYAPRFALSCTDDLLVETARAANEAEVRVHTHASENRDEIAEVERRKGCGNIAHLHNVGLTGPNVVLAHCIWLDEHERKLLANTGTHVVHCPSSNLKLGSGVAKIPELLEAGVSVSLGADGAPCNNNLDAFLEMRLAAMLQKPRKGAESMRAATIVKMATLGGAAALGLDSQIGSLSIGKRADVIVVDLCGPHVTPTVNPYSALVYACRPTDVRHVVVDGNVIVRDRGLLTVDVTNVVKDARAAAATVFDRMK